MFELNDVLMHAGFKCGTTVCFGALIYINAFDGILLKIHSKCLLLQGRKQSEEFTDESEVRNTLTSLCAALSFACKKTKSERKFM